MTRPKALAVLVVDDDEAVRYVLAEGFRQRGYAVAQAADGHDAWCQLSHAKPDIVVSDLQMPRCDGRELCRRIRSEPSLRNLGVVIITGGPDCPEPCQLNCDAVLLKPVSVCDLMAAIERLSSGLQVVSSDA